MNFEFLVKTRINLLKMLKHRNIDVSKYENFNQDEIEKMLRQSLLDKSFINQILIFRNELRKNLAPVHVHLPKSELLAAFVSKKRNFVN